MNRYALCRYNAMIDQAMAYRDTADRWMKSAFLTLPVAAVCAFLGCQGAALVWTGFYIVEAVLAWRAFTRGWELLNRAKAEMVEYRRVEAFREDV